MALPNIFDKQVADRVIERIDKLTPDTPARWGKMNAAQMLAHCNVTYEMVYDNKHAKPNFFLALMLKAFVKKAVVNEAPYKPSTKTAPAFVIKDTREFEKEKKRLVDYINRTQKLGDKHFDQKPSLSFGPLSSTGWSNMFYKHLDHHLTQFGV